MISVKIWRKKRTCAKSQEDGLTGLLNAATTKRLIAERLENKEDTNLMHLCLLTV